MTTVSVFPGFVSVSPPSPGPSQGGLEEVWRTHTLVCRMVSGEGGWPPPESQGPAPRSHLGPQWEAGCCLSSCFDHASAGLRP